MSSISFHEISHCHNTDVTKVGCLLYKLATLVMQDQLSNSQIHIDGMNLPNQLLSLKVWHHKRNTTLLIFIYLNQHASVAVQQTMYSSQNFKFCYLITCILSLF